MRVWAGIALMFGLFLAYAHCTADAALRLLVKAGSLPAPGGRVPFHVDPRRKGAPADAHPVANSDKRRTVRRESYCESELKAGNF
jgi:hypothetical protein